MQLDAMLVLASAVGVMSRADRRVLGALLRCVALGLLLSSCTDLASMEFDASDADALRYAQCRDLRAEVDAVVQPLMRKVIRQAQRSGYCCPTEACDSSAMV